MLMRVNTSSIFELFSSTSDAARFFHPSANVKPGYSSLLQLHIGLICFLSARFKQPWLLSMFFNFFCSNVFQLESCLSLKWSFSRVRLVTWSTRWILDWVFPCYRLITMLQDLKSIRFVPRLIFNWAKTAISSCH